MRNIFLGIGVVALIFVGGIFLFSKGENQKQTQESASLPTLSQDQYEYYWGNGCPHCKVVQDFLDSWGDLDKIQLEKYETWYNRDNANRLIQRASSCGIPQSETAVPFLFTPSNECIIGDTPIINYFESLDFNEEENS